MFLKLHDWRQDAVPIWVSIDQISAIQLMPATKERSMLTVVRIGNGSYSEWVRETPEQILAAIANEYGWPVEKLVEACGAPAPAAEGSVSP